MNMQRLPTVALYTILALLILCSLLTLILSGCAGSLTGRAPETRTFTVPYGQAQAYTRASQVLRQMGAEMTTMDGRSALQGMVHGAVLLSVQLQEQGTSTLVTVTGSIPAGKMVLGTMDELDQFCTRLQARETVHAR